MDEYQCSTVCLNVHELWNNKEIHLLEKDNQSMVPLLDNIK